MCREKRRGGEEGEEEEEEEGTVEEGEVEELLALRASCRRLSSAWMARGTRPSALGAPLPSASASSSPQVQAASPLRWLAGQMALG